MTAVRVIVADGTESSAALIEPNRSRRARILVWLRNRSPAIGRHGFLIALAIGIFLRYWRLNALGFNSDEAVYAGQAASIAHQSEYLPYFPIFRAHPLLFQSLLSLPFRFGVADIVGRMLAAAFGVGTLVVAYHLGKLLYGRRAGLVAMALLAVMPYHVTVSRQVLLDAPMVFFATAALYALARYCKSHQGRWLVATGALMGLAMVTKETAVILFGGMYCFFVLSHTVRLRFKRAAVGLAVAGVIALAFPLTLRLAGATRSGGNYLVWQLFRRANHPMDFYLTAVPSVIGLLVLVVVILGLLLDRKRLDWREGLLVSWCVVPIVFYTLMPIKGFQYLLPLAPPVAVLAARALTSANIWSRLTRRIPRWRTALQQGALVLVALSVMVPAWSSVQPSSDRVFLAGTGGLPAGREAGTWIGQNLPEGSTLLTVGPSMANVIAFYGHRQAYGLSVSPNPLNRNPSYTPVENADLQLRTGTIQYAVWDSFSAARSPNFSDRLLGYVKKYNGIAIHTETVQVNDKGASTTRPLIIVYELRP
jgi:4-amino-4-deoxy-L-arabinose transferase-like glycosyltransferase